VAGGDIAEVSITKPYTGIRLYGVRTTAGAGSTWKILLTQKR